MASRHPTQRALRARDDLFSRHLESRLAREPHRAPPAIALHVVDLAWRCGACGDRLVRRHYDSIGERTVARADGCRNLIQLLESDSARIRLALSFAVSL